MIGFWAVLIQEWDRLWRHWALYLLPAIVNVLLLSITFGCVLGEKVDTINGITYPAYFSPGLILTCVITGSYANVAHALSSDIYIRKIEELLISPLPSSVIVLGYICGGVLRGALVGVGAFIVALVLFRFRIEHFGLLVSTALLTSLLFSLVGFIGGLFSRSVEQVNWVPLYVLTPLTLVGGVFYPITQLPTWAHKISRANPLVYIIDTFRYEVVGSLNTIAVDVKRTLIALSLCVLLLFVCAMALTRKVIEETR